MKHPGLLLVPLLASLARLAAADVTSPAKPLLDLHDAAKHDLAFRRWIRQFADERGWQLSRWGWAQLDGDALPERFSVLCKSDSDDEGSVTVIEDAPGQRWMIDSVADCEASADPAWEREAPTTLTVRERTSRSLDETSIALREGRPAKVRSYRWDNETYGRDGGGPCFEGTFDLDALESRHRRCHVNDGVLVWSPPVRAALTVVAGASGRYRRTLSGSGEAPLFGVTVPPAGKRLRVSVKLERPARSGEGLELWTVGSAGRSLAWSATWDGARWQLRGLLRAPRELPPIDGDATTLTIPIVRREDELASGTPLTIVAVSADRATRVATSDLRDDDATTLGEIMDPDLHAPRIE